MPHGIFEPLVPQSAIEPLQRKLDQRRLDQSPEEAQLRGFGAGALEGLRGLTSPASLAGLLPGGTAAKLLQFAPKAARVAGPALDLIEQAPVRQVMPALDDVNALIGSMKHSLAKVPPAGMRQRVRAHMPTEFQQPLPSGPIQGLQRAVEPAMDEAYQKYIRTKVR